VRTAHDWYNVLYMLGVEPSVAADWSEVFADVVGPETFSAGDEDLSAFLGQILHESGGLRYMTEQMNYSAERLTVVWPNRFPTKADAAPYANNPEALANKVYGGRMGNDQPGDGWRYRARTPLGITGKDNYAWLGHLLGRDFVGLPELLEQPRFALEAAIAWWENKIPDSLLGDIEKTTRRVNGGTLGLAHREDLTDKAREALARWTC
jgi:putative chitinase